MAGRFTVTAVFKAVDRVTAPVTRMQNRVSKFTRKMSSGFFRVNRAVSKLGAKIKSMGLVATASLISLGFAFKNIIGVGARFGRAIGSAAAKFPDQIKRGTKEFKNLELAARKVGATTEFTAVQAAQGLNFLAKAGFNAKAAIAALPGVVDFATASELDFAEASDIATDALGAFNLDSKNLSEKMIGLKRVMDVMSLTSIRANTTVSQLFESMRDGGPVATAAGISIETFAATMGLLAQAGIKGTKAGTAAKNITLALAGIGNQASKTFKKLKIDLVDGSGAMKDQFTILDELRAKLNKFDKKDPRRLGIINAIFGKIPIAAASVLLNQSTKAVRALRKELINTVDPTKRIAKFIRDDVQGSIDGLISAIEGVKISIFSLNEGPLKGAIDKMTKWVRVNDELIAGKIGNFLLLLINNLEGIVKWTKRIGIGLAVFFAFSIILKTLVGVLTLINLVMLANPIVLIVLGVIAAIAAFTALVFWIDEIIAGFNNLSPILKFVLTPLFGWLLIIQFVKASFIDLMRIGGELGKWLFGFFNDSEGGFAKIVEGIDFVIEGFKSLIDWVSNLIDSFGGVKGIVLALLNPIGLLTKAFSFIIDNVDVVGKAVNAVSRLLGFGGGDDDEQTDKSTQETPAQIALRNAPTVINPQEQVVRSIEESRETSTAEVLIRAEKGTTAEVIKGKLGTGLTLIPSGAFE